MARKVGCPTCQDGPVPGWTSEGPCRCKILEAHEIICETAGLGELATRWAQQVPSDQTWESKGASPDLHRMMTNHLGLMLYGTETQCHAYLAHLILERIEEFARLTSPDDRIIMRVMRGTEIPTIGDLIVMTLVERPSYVLAEAMRKAAECARGVVLLMTWANDMQMSRMAGGVGNDDALKGRIRGVAIDRCTQAGLTIQCRHVFLTHLEVDPWMVLDGD